jgi:alkanesulfonate monooxygenase SsuD/methylene tetrahydromethanopterin reductase-like flavin-dependent oxidoreductase (luciferase family)
MSHTPRFQVLILPNLPWEPLLRRFRQVEELGFDLAVTGDHFVDWTNPPAPWAELWTLLAAVAQATDRIRLAPCVAQIPLRNPAMLAREALTVEHISGGRLEIGLGLGLPIDPSYAMAGIPNWSNRERADRFGEYVEIVDGLLSNEVTTYKGRFYEVDGAYMNPRPLQKPRPPITVAALGPRMLGYAATFADTWNTMSFAATFDEQLAETGDRVERIHELCRARGRDPSSLRLSFNMFDPTARSSGGRIEYYESADVFAERARRLMELGFTEIGVYYPVLEEQMPVFERIAREVLPELRSGA